MIPKYMDSFLHQRLLERTWRNRLLCENGMCFMEFGPLDIDRLSRLGIEVDALGPKLVACLWDENSPLEVGGYLVVDNLAMGRPSMGGIRMLPDLTPTHIFNLARGMTLKNAAALLPFGGGKLGIVTDPAISKEEHLEIVRRFAHLLYRYRDIFLPGPDVGTNDEDMKTIAIENGLDNVVSKPSEMGGNRIDQLGAAGGGLIIALETLLEELPRLSSLSRVCKQSTDSNFVLDVIIQGFGAVGAHAAKILQQRHLEARIVGISDASGYLYDPQGLPVISLYQDWQQYGLVTKSYYHKHLADAPSGIKYSNKPNDLLRESAFCVIPAAPIANYLDTDPGSLPSMTVDHMGDWGMIIEGANTYSPDPSRKSARLRMEREVYRRRGILIAPDFLVNSGGVIYASQEQLIKTPGSLRIPDAMLGDRTEVNRWLLDHQLEFETLAEKRRVEAERSRDEAIRRNMHELVDLLASDADMLPIEAAETISIRRITSREKDRTAADIMETIITIPLASKIRTAANLLVETGCPILAVVTEQNELAGVITNWDVTNAVAHGSIEDIHLEQVMTRNVITAGLDDTILELIRKLENYEISAMPVVKDKTVLGMVSTDLLSRRSLYRLLLTQS